MIKASIFDLDGTLINSLRDLADSSNYALARQGFPIYETERYRYFVGRGIPRLIEDILPEDARTPEILAKTRALFDGYYGAHGLDHTGPYEGIPEMLTALRKDGLRLAVVSNKADAFVGQLVTSLFPGVFDVVLGQREGIPHKPDPTGALEACRKMGAAPADCLYFGDSGVDMLTANAAGMTAVGVLWGFREKEELLKNGAQLLIAAPSEAADLIVQAPHVHK